ncbi:MAG TPA: hypothetical protein PLA50_10790, partial [Bacteroidia bacterium]|nr:hypothetical protein [Bacteroidia bacterium]
IIAAVKAERGDDDAQTLIASPTTAFLEMLPDAPLPFPEGAAPGDAAALKEFVKNQQPGSESGEPSPMERWQFNLALAALGVKPSEVPEAIRLETRPAPESDTYPVRLVPRQADPAKLKAPLAIGRFGDHASPGIVADGGSQLYLLDGEKGLVAHDGLTGVEPGHLVKTVDFDLDGHPD